jgi:hypothetical protein
MVIIIIIIIIIIILGRNSVSLAVWYILKSWKSPLVMLCDSCMKPLQFSEVEESWKCWSSVWINFCALLIPVKF